VPALRAKDPRPALLYRAATVGAPQGAQRCAGQFPRLAEAVRMNRTAAGGRPACVAAAGSAASRSRARRVSSVPPPRSASSAGAAAGTGSPAPSG